MKFGQTEIPGRLFKLARERMLREATFTPGEIRKHIIENAREELMAISSIRSNWQIVAERVMRTALAELRTAGEVDQLKKGIWAKTSFLAAAAGE